MASVREASTSSGIAVSSSPEAATTSSIGASDTGWTTTTRFSLVAAASEPPVDVAVTVSVKSASESLGGVIVSPMS